MAKSRVVLTDLMILDGISDRENHDRRLYAQDVVHRMATMLVSSQTELAYAHSREALMQDGYVTSAHCLAST